jgi:glycosyltransferase involved in cell wall biosynthesis
MSRYLRGEGDAVTFVASLRPPEALASSVACEFDRLCFLSDHAPTGLSQASWYLTTFRGARAALQCALRERADVLHCLYLDRGELALLASLSCYRRRPAVFGTFFWPYFVHDRDDRVGLGKRLFHAASRKGLTRLLERGLMDGLFVHSERIRDVLGGVMPRAAAERIVVVPDPAKEAPPIGKEEARRSLGLPLDTPVMLMFGGTRYDKGPDILLRALPRLGGEWIAMIIGDSYYVGEAQAEACRRSLSGAGRLITRFEFIPDHDADLYFRAADVVVLPYRKVFKGTSGVLQRAAASGKFVVVSDVGDVGPTVRSAGLGTVVPAESEEHLAAALEDFLAHREERQRDVESRALRYAAASDWRIVGMTVRESYLKALDRSRRSTVG